MKPFGQSKKDVEQLIADRDNGWVVCEKCKHLIEKRTAERILKTDSSGRVSYVYFGKSCKPAYDRIAYMPGGNWYFKAAEKTHDERVNEDGSSYYEEMGEAASVKEARVRNELHTVACKAHCDGPDCPCDGCIGMFKAPLNMNDAAAPVPADSQLLATLATLASLRKEKDLLHAKRLLLKCKAHIEEMERSWGGARKQHTDVRGKRNHELACEVRSFFGEQS